MEIVAALNDIGNLERLASVCDGFIFGGPFSLRYFYSLEELNTINNLCLSNHVKRYIAIDSFIAESDKVAIYNYFAFLKRMQPDGIYFTDLGIISIARHYDLDKILIYDPDTLITNSLDAAYYTRQGFGAVVARELSFNELFNILYKNQMVLDVQVFGHLKMSYSKRRFMYNYFKHFDLDIDINQKKTIQIVENNRDYALPILESQAGTLIYTDYVLLVYKELLDIKPLVKRFIVDDLFINDNHVLFDVVNDIRHLTLDNADFLYNALIDKYRNIVFSSGYLYQKTTKVKEENE